MGFHCCPFCPLEGCNAPELSSGEYYLEFEGGGKYHVPDMIVHYVLEHQFALPEDFLNDLATRKLVAGNRQQSKSVFKDVGWLTLEKKDFPRSPVPTIHVVARLARVLREARRQDGRVQTRGL